MSFLRFLLLLALLVSAAPVRAAEPGPVYVVALDGSVSRAQFFFLRRALKEAERAGASAFVIEMNTYGGEVTAAMENMEALLKTSVPTYTFINDKALSAGALITLATQHVYIAPSGVIGAAAPVQGTGEDLPKTMTEKTVSALTALARGAAQRGGHNADLADAFIRKEAVLKVGEETLDGPDSLLTLNAVDATRRIAEKPVLAKAVVTSLTEMLQKAGLTGVVHRVEPTGFERLAALSAWAPLLLLGGILGAWIEIKMPGFGIAGIASIVCFTLFFTGSYLAGLAGWETAIIFGVGVALILSEVFLHPGTILPGIAGLVLLFGSLLWAMVDRYPNQGWWPTSGMMERPLLNLTLAIVSASVVIFFLGKYLPQIPLLGRLVLGEVVPSSVALPAGHLQTGLTAGMQGKARTMLRPSGKAEFDGQLVDVISQGDLIAEGTALRILAVEGPRIVVAAT